MAQLVGRLTLDFGSGQDHRVIGLSLESGSGWDLEPGWDSFSLPLPLPK